jgi:hypothetical protein
MVGVGVMVGVEVFVGVSVRVGVKEGEALGVADGVAVGVAEGAGVYEGAWVGEMVGEAVAASDGLGDAVGGRVAVGNMVSVEADFDKPHEREIRAKVVTKKSKLALICLCIGKPNPLSMGYSVFHKEKLAPPHYFTA